MKHQDSSPCEAVRHRFTDFYGASYDEVPVNFNFAGSGFLPMDLLLTLVGTRPSLTFSGKTPSAGWRNCISPLGNSLKTLYSLILYFVRNLVPSIMQCSFLARNRRFCPSFMTATPPVGISKSTSFLSFFQVIA